MARSKQPNVALSLSRNWQLAFTGVLTASFLVEVGLLLHVYTSNGYIGRGTWTFQILTWGYPLLSAAAGFAYAWRRYRYWLHRAFWAVFLATLSTTVMNMALTVENQIRTSQRWYYTGNDPSYWLAFGWDWVTMGTCFVVYAGLLVFLVRRNRR